jgi:atypical dual specificity phosphatase
MFGYLLFYPTLWWNMALSRVLPSRRWWDWVDENVLLGALPTRAHVALLQREGIGAVINTCREYRGPLEEYRAAGIDEFYVPICDFTPPTLEQARAAVEFMERQIAAGRKVYVHCKAGRGRSATLVMCYLIGRGYTPESSQKLLLEKRPHVNRHLAAREVVREYAAAHSKSQEPRAQRNHSGA